VIKRLEPLRRLLTAPPPAWGWPLALTVMAVVAGAASLIFYPGGDEWTYLFGHRFGAGCSFLKATGQPCPSCGMTRSWVHLARGDVLQAFTYNAAGALLLLWILFAGVLGAARLITRNAKKWLMPYRVVAGFAFFWMFVPYIGLWVARMLGFNPLP